MSSRELVILGTSSQVPTRFRNHNGYFLRWDGVGFLLDPGEGTQRQMAHAGVSASQIHHVLISHFHGDHCMGMAGIFQRISLDEVPHVVHVWFPASGAAYLERLRYSSIYLDKARIELHPIAGEALRADLGAVILEAAPLEHGVESWGYAIQEPPRRHMHADALAERGIAGPDVGRLMREGAITVRGQLTTLDEVSSVSRGQRFAITMDTRPCAGAARIAAGADLLLCESTYLEADRADAWERFHMTAGDAARLARDAGVGRLVLTHFSQRYPDTAAFVAEAAVHHADVVAAVDLDVFKLR